MRHASFLKLASAALVLAGFAGASVPARAAMRHVPMNATGAPDFNFTSEPVDTHVPGTDIYYAREYDAADVYRTDDGWYAFCEGKWYNATTWTGPWNGVERSLVPARLISVPPGFAHYRHSMKSGRRVAMIHTRVQKHRASSIKS